MRRQRLNLVYQSHIFPIVRALFGDSVMPRSVDTFSNEVLVVHLARECHSTPRAPFLYLRP